MGIAIIVNIWIGYDIFGRALGKTTMSMEGAYVMATFIVLAMMVVTWVRMPAVTFEQAFETPTFKTHAGNALWSIYRAMGNIHPSEFAAWVVSHLPYTHKPYAEKGEFSDFTELENYLFSDAVLTFTHSTVGEGDIQCFVLEFWERQANGSKIWLRFSVTCEEGLIYIQRGKSTALSNQMVSDDDPKLIDVAHIEAAVVGFKPNQ